MGYLWAVIFGDGIKGLKGVPAVDNASSFPDANVALLVALFIYVVGPLAAVWYGLAAASRTGLLAWYASTAFAGLLLFGLSRLIV